MIRRRARAAGVEATVSCHRLRHSFATNLLAGGADLVSVSRLMGHSSVKITEHYVGVSDERLRAVCAKHPRAAKEKVSGGA
jgi:integrase/recombinase XerD